MNRNRLLNETGTERKRDLVVLLADCMAAIRSELKAAEFLEFARRERLRAELAQMIAMWQLIRPYRRR